MISWLSNESTRVYLQKEPVIIAQFCGLKSMSLFAKGTSHNCSIMWVAKHEFCCCLIQMLRPQIFAQPTLFWMTSPSGPSTIHIVMTMCIMLTSANFFGSQKAQEIKFSSRIQAETEQIQLVFYTKSITHNGMQLRFKHLWYHVWCTKLPRQLHQKQTRDNRAISPTTFPQSKPPNKVFRNKEETLTQTQTHL